MATLAHEPLLDTPKSKSSRCKLLCILLSLISLVGIGLHLTKTSPFPFDQPIPIQNCNRAHNPTSCSALVSEAIASVGGRRQINGDDLLQIFLKRSVVHVQRTIETTMDLKRRINDVREKVAVQDCLDLMDLSMDRITNSMEALRNRAGGSCPDAHTWLSGVLTNHVTCLDGLNGSARPVMEPRIEDMIERGRAALALLVSILPPSAKEDDMVRIQTPGFPGWVTGRDRKLLQATAKEIKANVVVAADGSGKYKTVKEAVASAPDNNGQRYVIYVKKGRYRENVEVGKKKKNVMLVGDGMDSTIITGSLNVIDGSTTFNSATVAAVGDGFIAQDIWFQNTAGPQKHQAVALRVSADQSVINRCRIDAFQDTLYAHANRQFYRDCSITGTVDFIFGNAAAVLQNCKIIPRKPMAQQSNMLTAQGRTDPNQNTGTSIQSCDIIASPDLEPVKRSIKTYLGRPWKEYSRTVVMQSNIGDCVNPEGWAPWSGDFALRTLYYGEYLNFGAGSGTGGRVKWSGYHVMNAAEARKFTVAELIQGGFWLKSTGVSFKEGL